MTDGTKYERILEGLGELKGISKSMGQDIQLIKADVNTNTKDLADHIAGVRTNVAGIKIQSKRLNNEIEMRDQMLAKHEEASQARFTELDKRLQIVEFLPNLLKGLWKVLKWLGAAAAAGLTITKFMGLW